MPLALVVAAVPVALPPPPVTANVTLMPATGLLLASRMMTLGGTETALPAVALWLLPALTAIELAGPAVPVALKVIGLPARPADVARSVFVPAVVPNVQLPT